MWKNTSNKKKYQVLGIKDIERYQNELKIYKKTNPDKSLFIKLKQMSKRTNAFGLFLQENIRKIEKESKPKEFFKTASKLWKQIPKDEK